MNSRHIYRKHTETASDLVKAHSQEISQLLKDVQGKVDYIENEDSVDWGDVGDLARIRNLLLEVLDRPEVH